MALSKSPQSASSFDASISRPWDDVDQTARLSGTGYFTTKPCERMNKTADWHSLTFSLSARFVRFGGGGGGSGVHIIYKKKKKKKWGGGGGGEEIFFK